MTVKNAKRLVKIGKYVLVVVLLTFFVIICIQSIKLNMLKQKQTTLSQSLAEKQEQYQEYVEKENYIKENFDDYSEEELKKDNYVKEDETFVTIKNKY